MTIENIIAEARSLVDASATSYPAINLTDPLLRRINTAYEEIIGKYIALDKNWKFDDSNFTDLPIGSATLVNSQQDYSIDTTLLTIERVEVKDSSGIWHKLSLVDEKNISGSLAEYQKTDGMPTEYAVRGNSIFLYPAPATASVTLTSGLKVYFQRGASTFTAAEVVTGTKTPGFAAPYHIILAYKAALPYAAIYKQSRVPFIMAEIQRLEKEMFNLASNKMNDKLSRLTPAYENCR